MPKITDSDYRTVSVRLPRQEFIEFDKLSKNTTHSAKLRELIGKEIKSNSKAKFLAGKNKIQYKRLNNSFSWLVQLDSGKETEVLSNLSDDFLKNLQEEIQEAIKQRNLWVHQTKPDSVGIPEELVGER